VLFKDCDDEGYVGELGGQFTPGVEFFVECGGGAADLRRVDVFQTKLEHHFIDIARAHALHIHLRERRDDGARSVIARSSHWG